MKEREDRLMKIHIFIDGGESLILNDLFSCLRKQSCTIRDNFWRQNLFPLNDSTSFHISLVGDVFIHGSFNICCGFVFTVVSFFFVCAWGTAVISSFHMTFLTPLIYIFESNCHPK